MAYFDSDIPEHIEPLTYDELRVIHSLYGLREELQLNDDDLRAMAEFLPAEEKILFDDAMSHLETEQDTHTIDNLRQCVRRILQRNGIDL